MWRHADGSRNPGVLKEAVWMRLKVGRWPFQGCTPFGVGTVQYAGAASNPDTLQSQISSLAGPHPCQPRSRLEHPGRKGLLRIQSWGPSLGLCAEDGAGPYPQDAGRANAERAGSWQTASVQMWGYITFIISIIMITIIIVIVINYYYYCYYFLNNIYIYIYVHTYIATAEAVLFHPQTKTSSEDTFAQGSEKQTKTVRMNSRSRRRINCRRRNARNAASGGDE